jgi:hypothetical protein
VLQLHDGNADMGDLGEQFLDCFEHAMDDAELPVDPAFRAALRAYMRWAVDDVLDYSPENTIVPVGAPTPRWGWDGLFVPRDRPRRNNPSGDQRHRQGMALGRGRCITGLVMSKAASAVPQISTRMRTGRTIGTKRLRPPLS